MTDIDELLEHGDEAAWAAASTALRTKTRSLAAEEARLEQESEDADDKDDIEVARIVHEKLAVTEELRAVEAQYETMNWIEQKDESVAWLDRQMRETDIMRWTVICSPWGRMAVIAFVLSFSALAAFIVVGIHMIPHHQQEPAIITATPNGTHFIVDPCEGSRCDGVVFLGLVWLWGSAMLIVPQIVPCFCLHRKYGGLAWRAFFCCRLGPLRWRHLICLNRYDMWRPGRCCD